MLPSVLADYYSSRGAIRVLEKTCPKNAYAKCEVLAAKMSGCASDRELAQSYVRLLRFDGLESTRMTTRTMIGIVALLGMTISGMILSFKIFQMVDKVNDRLPKQEQFDPLSWYLSKRLRLRRAYKKLYPHGRLLSQVDIATALMFACLLICAWGFGIFGKWP
jgi:hypothetical protein